MSIADKELASFGNDRSETSKLLVVSVRDFEYREPPDTPPGVTLLDGSGQVVVVECSDAETDNDE